MVEVVFSENLSTFNPQTSECYKHIRESLLCGSFSLLESRKTDAEIFVDSSTRKSSKSWGQPRIKPLGLHGTVPSIPLGKRHAGHQPAMQGHLVKGIVTPCGAVHLWGYHPGNTSEQQTGVY
jgi:hypothetical protein